MNKRTKALAISTQTKKKVAARDSFGGFPCCILCGTPAPFDNRLAFSCAHVLRRSRGGLGLETNIVTLCPACHLAFDSGDKEKEDFIISYMKKKYGDGWNLEDQRYWNGGT